MRGPLTLRAATSARSHPTPIRQAQPLELGHLAHADLSAGRSLGGRKELGLVHGRNRPTKPPCGMALYALAGSARCPSSTCHNKVGLTHGAWPVDAAERVLGCFIAESL